MRGRGDSYALPIGESSREDMDFTALSHSRFDERTEGAGGRRASAFRHCGVARNARLHSPGSACQPSASSLDPAADFGDRILRARQLRQLGESTTGFASAS